MDEISSIVGMHFIKDCGDNFRFGEVVGQVGEAYLVKFDDFTAKGSSVPLPLELASVAEMLEVAGTGTKRFGFFRTREELDAWWEWLDTPEGSERVVSLVKK